MANFEQALSKVLKWEGGWYDGSLKGDPNPTMKGITLKTYQYYFGKDKTAIDLKNITNEQVMSVYRDLFWNKIKGDQIDNQCVAELLFDFSCNSGCKVAVRKIQKILSITEDGIVGNQTLRSINTYPSQRELFQHLWNVRQKYYQDIVKRSPSKKVFAKGWNNRLQDYQYHC